MDCGLQGLGGVAIAAVFEDGTYCVAEAACVEFATGDYYAGALCCDACGYAGLVVALWNGDEGNAFG